MPVDGVVNFFKPRGMTSQRAVNTVKKLFSAAKAGHCGTLDPDASGVLPVMLGTAVKMFIIAGPVIVYGVVESVILGTVYYIISLFTGA